LGRIQSDPLRRLLPMIRSARPVPAGVPLATHPSAISVCEPMIREILLTGLKKGIGLAIDRSP